MIQNQLDIYELSQTTLGREILRVLPVCNIGNTYITRLGSAVLQTLNEKQTLYTSAHKTSLMLL